MVTGEDHTLGNSFRYVLAKNRKVDFVGYSIPHPSEMKLNMRIQTKGQRGGGGNRGALRFSSFFPFLFSSPLPFVRMMITLSDLFDLERENKTTLI